MLSSYFDRIYVINLDSRKDRRKLITRELTRCGISIPSERVHFFSAIRPLDKGNFPSIGSKGCFLSHLAILKKAQEEGLKNILILEDDFFFYPKFKSTVSDYCATLEKRKWDIAYLGHFLKTPPTTTLFIPYKEKIDCTHCVAFQNSVFNPLISFLEMILKRRAGDPKGGPMHVDGAYSTFRIQNPNITTLVAQPSLGGQRASFSDIAPSHWLYQIPGSKKLLSSIHFIKNKLG